MKFDDVAKEFIDFVNQQVGVYMASIAGFAGAKIKMERQVARIMRAQSRKTDARGDAVIAHESLEDPRRPDVIHARIVTADIFIDENAPSGLNHRQLSYSVIIFIFTFWEDEIRPRLAKAKGVEPNDIKCDIMGDLRCVRNSILHTKGVFSHEWHKGLRVLHECFEVERQIEISHELMHQIFVKIKQGCAKLIFEWLGVDPEGRFDFDQLKDFAIHKPRDSW
jgi:hypothetical protein